MSEMTAVLGAEFSFEFEGRTWKIGPRDFDVERRMTLALEQRDYNKIRQHAELLGAAMSREQVADWRRTCTAGHWEYGGDGFREYYSSSVGLKQGFLILLTRWNPGFDPAVMDRIWKDDAKLGELDTLADAANADPTTPGQPTPNSTPS